MFKPSARSLSISSQESYSAVMIADLVAEVPVNPAELEQASAKPIKEKTNLAYDGHLDGEAKSAAVDGIDVANSHLNKGGISRGVILNAVQFGQPDSKSKSDEKAIQMTGSLPVPQLTQQISEPHGFKDMSFLRKIAFGFSFLPSVLFVLCFAIILPCNVPKPCVEELWVTTLNNTEAISKIEIPQEVIFAAVKDQKSVLMELYKGSGIQKEAIKLEASAAYLECGKIMSADRTDCIVVDEEGKFYSFNQSQKKDIQISEEQPSPPVILLDCNGDKIDEVAIAVSNTTIKILSKGAVASTVPILDCDSTPTKLMSWAINGSSDIVFVCTKDGADVMGKVPQNMWCNHTVDSTEEVLILYNGSIDSLNNAIIQTIDDGLVLWSGEEVSLIQPDGSLLWTVSNVSHSEENRFVLYGMFDGEKKQVALLSSNLSSGIEVTLLEASNGNHSKFINIKDYEAIDAVTVQGKKKDFILILHKKVKKFIDTVAAALTQISDISTTIVNLISNDEASEVPDEPTSEELSFLDLDSKLITVKDLNNGKNIAHKTSMTAVYDKEMDVLHIYLLSTSQSDGSQKTTKVRNISIANWNKSKKAKCLGKALN